MIYTYLSKLAIIHLRIEYAAEFSSMGLILEYLSAFLTTLGCFRLNKKQEITQRLCAVEFLAYLSSLTLKQQSDLNLLVRVYAQTAFIAFRISLECIQYGFLVTGLPREIV